MQAKSFLIFNGIVVLLLVLRLVLVRKGERPTPLDFSEPVPKKPVPPHHKRGFHPQERMLSCPFLFEGKSYDAFEVLGVPAGAKREDCYRAYIDLSRRSGPQTPVVNEAWRVLENHFLRGRFS